MSTPMNDEYGKRLLVSQVDHLAETKSTDVFASFPKAADFTKGFRDVNWKDFANSINRAAHWLEKSLGGKGDSFETIAYIGAADIRYFILTLAANKTGYKLLVLSPRNSLEGQLSLLDKLSCTRFLRSEKTSITNIQTARPSIIVQIVPSLEDFLDPTPVSHYSFSRTFEEAQLDPFVVFHSSGSTGLPKPIVCTQGVVCTFDALHNVAPLDGKETFYPYFAKLCRRIFICLPFSHSAAVVVGLCQAVYFGSTCVWGHPDRPLNPDVMDEVIEHGRIDGMFTAPSILDEMSKAESSLERLSKLKLVLSGAGPLPTPAGKRVSEKAFLAIGAGSTEAFPWITHVPDPEDWRYFLINTDASGMEMRLDTERNLYEMVYVRRPDREHLQAIFKTFPDKQEYATGDMFEPHPTKPHFWRIVGRRDDMLVLSNGENVQPGPLQDLLSEHPAVREALVVGQGRFQVAAIIELRSYPSSEQEAEKLMDEIWPSVEEANRVSPTHARLLRQFMRFADPNKPFVRVGKGTISKPPTLSLYAPEIEELYSHAEASVATDLRPLDISNQTALQASLLPAIATLLGPGLQDAETNFFLAGADSLTAMTMAASLKKSLQAQVPSKAEAISSRLIYANPTVNALSSVVMSIVDNSHGGPQGPNSDESEFNALVSQALEMLPQSSTTILLTGSTGSLGSYILDQLIADVDVRRAFCLNRSSESEARQRASAQERGLNTDFSKVVFLTADLSRPELGVDAQSYRDLVSQVTHIIHAQWPVNWNIALSTFSSHISGVARLATLAAESSHRPKISFCSSVAAVQNWCHLRPGTPVPESTLSDVQFASSGYGLSKLAATVVLERAAHLGVRSTILRIGQIAGPADDAAGSSHLWPKQEWLPSLIASSRFLGAVPDNLAGAETVDWISVNRAARAICQVALADSAEDTQYAHIVSPRTTTWGDTVLPAVSKFYRNGLKVIPLQEWVLKLKESAAGASTADVQRNPAVKLLDFYEGLAGGYGVPRLATEKSVKSSEALKTCEAVRAEDVAKWLAEWAF